MPVQLTSQASAALHEVMRQNNGQLPSEVETRLAAAEKAAVTQQGVVPLSLREIEQMLTAAMPSQQKVVQDACSIGGGYQGTNARFLTQILSARVEKIDEVRHTQPTAPAVPRRYDPYHAEFSMDPRAQSMLLFNAQNVDRSGNALLMKVVMRMTPKLDAVVLQAEADVEALVKTNLAALQRFNGAITASDVGAAFGLPHDGGADLNNTTWITQVSANAAWMAQNMPKFAADKARAAELVKAVGEAKQKYIDEQLPKLDLTRYRREPHDAKPDVQLVGSAATFVKTTDTHETEFNFGAPLKQVSLGANNKELSSSVFVRPENEQFNRAWSDPAGQRGRVVHADQRITGDHLDRQGVVTFDDRIRVSVQAKDAAAQQPGSWLDEAGGLKQLDVKLHLDRGIIFEPGSQATVSVLGNTVGVAVSAENAALLGNSPVTQSIDTSTQSMTVRQFLSSQVTRSSWAQAQKTDATNQAFTVASLVYSNAANINVGARTLSPLGDTVLSQLELAPNKIKMEAVPLPDPNDDGVKLTLTLDEGFLNSEKASVKGYTMQVGYFDEANKWIEAKRCTVTGSKSKKEELVFEIPDFDALQKPKDAQGIGAKRLEVRIYNADGVPAERIQIPFRETSWHIDD